ncbi:HAD family hydrolase [Agromyces intestinalis]|uniref:HAD family hydrolase n=1 Tax=Agromyces intestinalis TaxID=2592652 RepID=A0A5C1YDA1_9MICO|nr:HAD family hydrolase [Agromyces intestinalis]QEO13608.1 HAD family hydrolase [Agromyces intestinalis]
MTLPAAVLFDLDDTLFAHRGAVARGILTYLDAVGIVATDADAAIADWYRLEEHHYHRYLAGELAFEGQRRARARDFAASHGVELTDDEAGEWFTAYFEHYRAAWTLHDDALPCLDALRAKRGDIRFGLITNGDLAFQQRKVAQVGLDRVIDLLVASGAVGIVKPDARIFHHACELLGVDPADAAYVGDRLRTDAIGAAEAGLTGVWLNRVGAIAEPAEAARAAELGVLEITSLDELPAALAP